MTCLPTSTDTRRYVTATRPTLGQYFTDTWPTLRSLGQLLSLSSIFSTQLLIFSSPLKVAFSGRCPFLAFHSGNNHPFRFSSYVFCSSLLLYMTLVTSESSSFWGLLLSELHYFRGAKNDIKIWYVCPFFLPHGWVFHS